jgi:uncharacterized protein (TIGR00255 family)
MTGFGAAIYQEEGIAVSVELKAVNNRYFKLSLRMSEGYSVLEQRVEPLIRSEIERGTINAAIRIRKERKDSDYKISVSALESYFKQLTELNRLLGQTVPPNLDRLVALPGVIETEFERSGEEVEKIWNLAEKTIQEALNGLQIMRKSEGGSMTKDLSSNIELLKILVENIERLATNVAPLYRQRLMERISKVMSEQVVTLNDVDLLREVALFADRCDISEETVRFRSHLEQFSSALTSKESCGRKLDFLTQELFRETNTMGSKANDAEITKNVVEMKTVIERIREMVQNVE